MAGSEIKWGRQMFPKCELKLSNRRNWSHIEAESPLPTAKEMLDRLGLESCYLCLSEEAYRKQMFVAQMKTYFQKCTRKNAISQRSQEKRENNPQRHSIVRRISNNSLWARKQTMQRLAAFGKEDALLLFQKQYKVCFWRQLTTDWHISKVFISFWAHCVSQDMSSQDSEFSGHRETGNTGGILLWPEKLRKYFVSYLLH